MTAMLNVPFSLDFVPPAELPCPSAISSSNEMSHSFANEAK
jgi:hypothetical protein